MTDAELLARLRDGCNLQQRDGERAAKRIEALTAKLATCEKYRDAYDEMGRIGTQAVRALEIKLAKAAEALDMLVRDCEADYPPSHGAIKHFAIAALAELKGESHE